jgi:hypothetical protein
MRKMSVITDSDWTTERRESFQRLKDILRHGMLLHFPDFGRGFCVATDASDCGIGAVLYQLCQGPGRGERGGG